MAKYIVNGREITLEKVNRKEGVLKGFANEREIEIEVVEQNGMVFVKKRGVLIPVFFAYDNEQNLHIHLNGSVFMVHKKTIEEEAGKGEIGNSGGRIEPPMPGKILKVFVKEGSEVEENQVLVLMESMKLQVEVKAPFKGVIKKLNINEGQTVGAGEVMVEIEKSV